MPSIKYENKTITLIKTKESPKNLKETFNKKVKAVRIIFAMVSILSLSIAINKLSIVFDSVVDATEGKFVIPDNDMDFKDTILAKATTAALTQDFDAIIVKSLNQNDMAKAEIYKDLAEYLGITLQNRTLQLHKNKNGYWEKSKRWAKECVQGSFAREIDTIESAICMIGADYYVPILGDTLDLGWEGINYLQGKETDKLIITMAIASLTLQTHEYYSKKDKTLLKNSINTIGIMAKASKGLRLSKNINKQIRHIATNSINIKTMKMTAKGQKEFGEIFSHTKQIFKHGRKSTPIAVLKTADDLAELPFYVRTTRIFGKQTDGLLMMMGKGLKKSFYVAGKAAITLYQLQDVILGWSMLIITSISALLVSMSSFLTNKILKRWILKQA